MCNTRTLDLDLRRWRGERKWGAGRSFSTDPSNNAASSQVHKTGQKWGEVQRTGDWLWPCSAEAWWRLTMSWGFEPTPALRLLLCSRPLSWQGWRGGEKQMKDKKKRGERTSPVNTLGHQVSLLSPEQGHRLDTHSTSVSVQELFLGSSPEALFFKFWLISGTAGHLCFSCRFAHSGWGWTDAGQRVRRRSVTCCAASLASSPGRWFKVYSLFYSSVKSSLSL